VAGETVKVVGDAPTVMLTNELIVLSLKLGSMVDLLLITAMLLIVVPVVVRPLVVAVKEKLWVSPTWSTGIVAYAV
jgi:hypothetical protein